MRSDLSTTSYALLGLLVFDGETSSHGLTGYELKQRADRTLRFYWVSPAMSQIYTELGRLTRDGLAEPVDSVRGRRTTRRYRITGAGRDALHDWWGSAETEFPTLKHPVALRLLMAHLRPTDDVLGMLEAYVRQLAIRRSELLAVREGLGDADTLRFPAMVADWGLAYYDFEAQVVSGLADRVRRESSAEV